MKRFLNFIKINLLNISIKRKIAIMSLATSIIPILIISTVFYKIYSNSQQKSLLDLNTKTTRIMSNITNDYFSSLFLSFQQAYNIKDIEDILSGRIHYIPNDNLLDGYFNATNKLSVEQFFNIAKLQSDILKISIYGSNGALIDSWDKQTKINIPENDPNFKNLLNNDKSTYYYYSYYESSLKRNLLVYSRNIYDLYTKEKIGVVIFHINLDGLKKSISKYGLSKNSLMILDSNHRLLFSSDKQTSEYIDSKFTSNLIDDNNINSFIYRGKEKVLVSYERLPGNELIVLNMLNYNEIKNSWYTALKVTLLFLLIITIFILFLSRKFQKYISAPIINLSEEMHKAEKGILNIYVEEGAYGDEISNLNRSFNNMINELNKMITIKYELELKNKDAQIIALKSQINPHFLYNTLQTIGGKAILNDDYEINDMCRALSDYFRYSIKNKNDEVTVYDEFTHISNYLYIQYIRFNEYLKININIPDELYKCKILNLIIQPILENSIIYGLEKNSTNLLSIDISIKLDEENLLISISDNGPGISSDKLTELNSRLDDYSKALSNSSIGIVNVNSRIKLFYGNDYGLCIRNLEPIGTEVIIKIPFHV